VHVLLKGNPPPPAGFNATNPTLLPSFVNHLRTLGTITHAAHVSWKTDGVFTSTAGAAVHGVQAIARLNPDWQVWAEGHTVTIAPPPLHATGPSVRSFALSLTRMLYATVSLRSQTRARGGGGGGPPQAPGNNY
jgi:hypothetical protein